RTRCVRDKPEHDDVRRRPLLFRCEVHSWRRGRCRGRHAARDDRADRARLPGRRRLPRVDASAGRRGYERVGRGWRGPPRARHQRHLRRLPDDVRPRRRLRTYVHALVSETHWRSVMNRRRLIAWILVLVVDASYIAWGGMAAAFPDHLLGPGGAPILIAGYEG